MGRLTLWGIYQYDPDLFEDVVLPEGYIKEDLINKIMRSGGMLYPYHQVPPQLKINISTWFRTRYYDFQQMYAAFHAVYNPIENYDRRERLERDHDDRGADSETKALGTQHTTAYGRKDTTTYGREDTTTYGREDTTTYGREDTTTYGREDTTTYGHKEEITHGLTTTVTPNTQTTSDHTVSAYNANSYQPRNKDITTESGTNTSKNSGTDIHQFSDSDSLKASGSDKLALSGSDKLALSGSDSVELSGKDILSASGQDVTTTNYGKGYKEVDENHIHGNIGVTTNQQMITAEIEMRMKYDLYEVIYGLFEKEFLIQVY